MRHAYPVIFISPCSFATGWQNPISCDDEPDTGYYVTVFACEGSEQRVVPTGVAPGGNEMDDAPEFQRKALSESGSLRKSRMGMDTT